MEMRIYIYVYTLNNIKFFSIHNVVISIPTNHKLTINKNEFHLTQIVVEISKPNSSLSLLIQYYKLGFIL